MEAGWSPYRPNQWATGDVREQACLDEDDEGADYQILERAKAMFTQMQWEAAEHHYMGQGLGGGMPALGPVARARRALGKDKDNAAIFDSSLGCGCGGWSSHWGVTHTNQGAHTMRQHSGRDSLASVLGVPGK